ncbi:MAG TPA: phosphoglycerate kinase [Candidatus Paceibacterota bacterium]|nr:phosphoglycerate kinase [Candidatus Paceibacterota bacterium]
MSMRTLDDAGGLKGKVVLMRTDFDVPVGADGIITETFRIERQRATLEELVHAGAHVVMAAHISAVPSFEPLLPQLQRILGVQILFCRDFDEKQAFLARGGTVALLENLRSNPGEEDDNEAFAGELVAGCDVYVNNAFAVCHREHASVASAPLIVPSFAGRLVVDEVTNLRRVIEAPVVGKVVVMGGAKVDTKLPVINHLVDKAEAVAVGGKIANEMQPPIDPRVRLPVDFADERLDIGPKTAEAFSRLCAGAQLIVWNGPMGKFEDDRFCAGTKAVAEAIAASRAFSVIGGGDTIAAVAKVGIPLARFGFVSTGGGAMLAFLAGTEMPGLRVLGYTAG